MELKGLKKYIGKRVKYRLDVDITARGKCLERWGLVEDVCKRTNELCIDGDWYHYQKIKEIETID